MCFLAYGLGLRHAVDADHIAAIDNVTRKLMQENQRPVAVGLFFSLGHSTIVVLMSLLVAQGTGYVKNHFPEFQAVGGIIGTSISAFFLLLIAVVNLIIFLEVFKRFQAVRKGDVNCCLPTTKARARWRNWPPVFWSAQVGQKRFLPRAAAPAKPNGCLTSQGVNRMPALRRSNRSEPGLFSSPI